MRRDGFERKLRERQKRDGLPKHSHTAVWPWNEKGGGGVEDEGEGEEQAVFGF